MSNSREKRKKDKHKAAERRRQEQIVRQQQTIDRQLAEARKSPPPPKEEKKTSLISEPLQGIKIPSSNELGPEMEDELWDEFENADLEGRYHLFLHSLESGNLDEEYAFEMLSAIHHMLDAHDPQARSHFNHAMDLLRQHAPDLYMHDAQYYNDMLISHAVIDGHWEEIPDLLTPYTDPKNLDIFEQVKEKLLYHGQERLLIQMMAKAWTQVKGSSEIFDWAIDEFGGDMLLMLLDDYLETNPSPRPDDPILLEATAPFGVWKEGWLERFIPRLSAAAPSPWTPEDFGPQVDADQWLVSMNNLLAEFVADRRRAGVPYSRGRMAWRELSDILEEQFSSGTMTGQKKHGKGKKAKGGPPATQVMPLSMQIPAQAKAAALGGSR